MKKEVFIMSVSLESTQKYKAYAIYDKEVLVITDAGIINTKKEGWRKELKDEIIEKTERSEVRFITLVEDKTQEFCVGDASPFSFEDMEEDKTMLSHALDWYFTLLGAGKLRIADNKLQGDMIQSSGEGQAIDRKQDDKGRTIYRVDWNRIRGGTRAILMCVVAAMMPPLTNMYIESMFGAYNEEEHKPTPSERFRKLMDAEEKVRTRKWEKFYEENG